MKYFEIVKLEQQTTELVTWTLTLTNNPFLFSSDSLYIYDGASSTSPMMGQYCGDSIPPSHVSSSNEILIHFEADYYNDNNNGFNMEYNPTGKQNTPIQNNTEHYEY